MILIKIFLSLLVLTIINLMSQNKEETLKITNDEEKDIVDQVLGYIEYFKNNKDMKIPYKQRYPDYPDEVNSFIDILATNNFFINYEYNDYEEYNGKLISECINELDWVHLKAFFTMLHRGERFCDGYIAGMVENGNVLQSLYRLRQLVAQA